MSSVLCGAVELQYFEKWGWYFCAHQDCVRYRFSNIPRTHDMKETIITRIAFIKYLNDIVICNTAFSVLNENIQSHWPKRKSEGVFMVSIFRYNRSDGEGQVKLVMKSSSYTSYRRHLDHWHGKPMNSSTFVTDLTCWRACWPVLTEIFRRCSPTHCQLLFYYGAFKSCIRQYRDESYIQYIKDIILKKFRID